MAAIDKYSALRANESMRSAGRIDLVTPSDSTDLTVVSRGIAFGTAGALKVTDIYGNTTVIPSGVLSAGIIHPLELTRIWSTSTTAANIVAFSGA